MLTAVMRSQLRLLRRNWAFWAVALGSVFMAVSATEHQSMASVLFWLSESSVRFFLLGQILVTAALAQRERVERVSELIESMPYRPAHWVLGRFLASYGAWLAVSAVLWAVAAAAVSAGGQPLDLGRIARHWRVIAPATLAFTTALGLALGHLTNHGITPYLAAAAVWTAAVSLPLMRPFGTWFPFPLLDFLPNDRFYPVSSATYLADALPLLLHRLFTLAVAGAACALVAWRLGRRRGVGATAAVLALAIALGTAAGAVAGARSIREGRLHAFTAEAQAATEYRAEINPAGPLRADGYRLDVAVAPGQHRIRVSGSFDVTNTGPAPQPEVNLTLRAEFQVESVTGPDGQPIPFGRGGDALVVRTGLAAGETIRLAAVWGGEVWQWRFNGSPQLAAHVAPESIFLPAIHGWYPLANRQLLRYPELAVSRAGLFLGAGDVGVHHPPAAVAVTVTGTDLHVITNAGPDATGVYIIGTPWETVTMSGLAVTASPANRVQAARLAAMLAERAAYYDTLLPRAQPAPIRMIEVHDTLFYGSSYMPMADAAPGAILLRNLAFGDADGNNPEAAVALLTQLWWPTSRASDGGTVFRALGLYMQWTLTGEIPIRADEEARLFLETLVAVEEARGRGAALGILRRLHPLVAADGPTLDDFAAAVSAAAGDSPGVAAALDQARTAWLKRVEASQ